MAFVQKAMRPALSVGVLFSRSAPVRPMATASKHISLSGYILPRSTSSSSSSSSSSSEGSNSGDQSSPAASDLEVGELQGAKFKIEPLRRTGEDEATTRARLLCESPQDPPSSQHTSRTYKN